MLDSLFSQNLFGTFAALANAFLFAVTDMGNKYAYVRSTIDAYDALLVRYIVCLVIIISNIVANRQSIIDKCINIRNLMIAGAWNLAAQYCLTRNWSWYIVNHFISSSYDVQYFSPNISKRKDKVV